jgi:chitin disaccharide deacetylase
VVDAGLTPTHLDWHCLADGGRDDIFDLTLALAQEHGLALRAWLKPGLEKLRGLPAGLSEWAMHPGFGDDESQAIDPGWRVRQTDHEFLTSPEARELVEQEGIIVIDYSTLQRAWSALS